MSVLRPLILGTGVRYTRVGDVVGVVLYMGVVMWYMGVVWDMCDDVV